MDFSDEESIGKISILQDNGSEDEYLPSDADVSSSAEDETFDQSDKDEAEVVVEGRTKRYRKRKVNEWKRVERKRKRNAGKTYITRKGKLVAGKEFSNPDCCCRKKCFNRISEKARQSIFESFWKIGTYSAQNALICGLVKQVAPQRRRPTTNAKKEKSKVVVEGRTKRYRKRKVNEWKRVERKRKRNAGKTYITRKGKLVAGKEFSNPDCCCRKKCFNRISEKARQSIFESFWKIGTYSAQNALICGLVKQVAPQRRRPTTNAKKGKSTSNTFYLTVDGKSEVICKKYFLETYKISDGRMIRALKKVNTGECPGDDKRGKKVPANKPPEEKMVLVREHISSFPSYQSHYTRSHNPDRKYLSDNLNIRLLYNLYRDDVGSQGIPPVEEHIYRQTFNNEFNLHCHAPHKDTCMKCDVFANKLKCTTDEEEKRKLKQEHELHLRKAEKARESLKVDSETSASDNSYYAFSFDLEKSLPFPKLACQLAYYKRNLYVYNLGCHELSSKVGFMYCWDEVTGSKGSQEIAVCLVKHIETRASAANHVVMYSDTCTDQNRNWKVAMTLMKLVQSEDNSIEVIDQKFMLSGHSYLPNDCDFASIENFSRMQSIFTPNDWYQVISRSRKKNPFHVTIMSSKDFLSVENLLKNITKRKKDSEGYPVSWLNMQWIRYQKSEPFLILFKDTLSKDMPFYKLNFMPESKKGRPVNLRNINQEKLYKGPRPVTKEKKNDMKDLLPYIPPINHHYYESLVSNENAVDSGPLSNTNESSDDE